VIVFKGWSLMWAVWLCASLGCFERSLASDIAVVDQATRHAVAMKKQMGE
jgi:hypothetical protein